MIRASLASLRATCWSAEPEPHSRLGPSGDHQAQGEVTTDGSTILALFGDVTEDNDRIARLELRPNMAEGQELAFRLRMWGSGHWCRADGQSHYFTRRADAVDAAEHWISTGTYKPPAEPRLRQEWSWWGVPQTEGHSDG